MEVEAYKAKPSKVDEPFAGSLGLDKIRYCDAALCLYQSRQLAFGWDETRSHVQGVVGSIREPYAAYPPLEPPSLKNPLNKLPPTRIPSQLQTLLLLRPSSPIGHHRRFGV